MKLEARYKEVLPGMNTLRMLLTLVLLSAVLPTFVFAHPNGTSWEQVFNQYKVDVGYDPSSFVVGEPVRLDFNVTREQGGQDVDFADVWVRVVRDETTVFATGVHKPSIGRAGMTFTFPAAGAYSLHVRFEKAGESIVDATFPMTVNPLAVPKKTVQPLVVLAWTGWPVAVVSIIFLVFRRESSRFSA